VPGVRAIADESLAVGKVPLGTYLSECVGLRQVGHLIGDRKEVGGYQEAIGIKFWSGGRFIAHTPVLRAGSTSVRRAKSRHVGCGVEHDREDRASHAVAEEPPEEVIVP
jgi:hypothetical protein